MEKQQIIHNKWSDLGITLLVSQYDFDGWIDVNELEKEQITSDLEYKKYRENEFDHETMLCRPKSLKGIEDNNGWTKIESVDDLPDNIEGLWEVVMNGEQKFIELLKDNRERLFKDFKKDGVTHYQIKEKSLSPIF